MMRKLFTSSLLILTATMISAQHYSYQQMRNLRSAKVVTINVSELPEPDFELIKVEEVAPEPGNNAQDVKQELDAKRQRLFKPVLNKYQQSEEDLRPEILRTFDGLPSGGSGIPNDNNMAISNDGMVISVINSSVSIFDSVGNRLKYFTLANIVSGQLPNLNRTYDPKVVYDPGADRFILTFLQGSTSADTRIIIGFTETSDATGNWNFYAINGNPFGGTTWSDYPIIGINESDFFVTVNILRDNESWQEGFTQSVIWQVDKQSGYDGKDSIYQDVFYDLKYDNKSIWSICTAPGGSKPSGDHMYFLSVRPGDKSNDTLFLHKISGSQQSGQASYSLSVHKTSLPYGVPPSAFQPDPSNLLQTNDTRVLSALEEGGVIQYVQSTVIPENGHSGIFHGVLDLKSGTIENSYIQSDTFDFAYPSIALAGSEDHPYASVITFSHVSELHEPGTAVAFHNRLAGQPSIISNVAFIKEGEASINRLTNDSNERWGDYTGIQRRYNHPGEVWMCGSYGKLPNRNSVWIGSVKLNLELTGGQELDEIVFFPNPTYEWAVVRFNNSSDRKLVVKVMDMNGKLVFDQEAGLVTSGIHDISLNTDYYRNGIYEVWVTDDQGEVVARKRFMVY